MADPSEDTTPLVASDPPAPAPTSSIKWYNYVVLVFIILGVVTAVLSSVESIWKFLFVAATAAVLAELYLRHIYVLKPAALPNSFLITQVGFGYFLAPLALGFALLVLVIVLSIVFVIFTMLLFAVFAAIYPDAVTALSEDLEKFADDTQNNYSALLSTFSSRTFGTSAETFRTFVDAARTVPTSLSASLSFPAAIARVASSAVDPKEIAERAKQMAEKIWNDMVAAGASPVVMSLFIALFILVAMLLSLFVLKLGKAAILEGVKMKLFKRHRFLPGSEPDSAAAALGVKGLVFFAVTGTAAIPLSVFVFSAPSVVPTFVNSAAFAVATITNVLIICVSQILVATAFAEHAVLGQPATLKKALRTSVLFYFGLSFLGVPPGMKGSVELTPGLWSVLVFNAVRVYLLYRFGMPFLERFKAAVEAENAPGSESQA